MSDTDIGLNEALWKVLRGVRVFPLISSGELAPILGLVFSTVSRHLARLEDLELVDSAVMGAEFPAARRYRLTPDGARRFLEPEVFFHLTRNLNTLSCLLPGLEQFYRLAVLLPQLTNVGPFRSFDWRLRDGADAMAHYEHGTVALFWSGPWQSKRDFTKRLVDLGSAAPAMGGWPALLCVVTSDLWQLHQVEDVLLDLGITDGALLVYASDGKMYRRVQFAGRTSNHKWLCNPLLGAAIYGVPAQMPRMMTGVRSGDDASLVYRLLALLEQFQGLQATAMVRALGSKWDTVQPKLQRLRDDGMVVERDGHHFLSDDSLSIAARRDRVHRSRPLRRFGLRADGLPAVARHRKHDAAAFGIVSLFQRAGFPVAGGWRGEDYSGGRDAIAPDAMIFMGAESSGGEDWYYLEYERRANSAGAVRRKLRGYIARGAKDNPLPVLMAARSDSMAAEFRRQAGEAGYPLWAASIPSIRVVDPRTVWGHRTVWLDPAGRPAIFLPA